MIPLDAWLDHLKIHLQLARVGSDPEGVHQVRVATRRLAVWIQLRGGRALLDDLRWLRHRAGDVRDLDVLIERRPPVGWRRWMAGQRLEARSRLLAALDDRRLDGLLEALSLLPPLDDQAAQARIPILAREVLDASAPLRRHPRDLDAVHRLRRALRRLRYGLEWLGRETGTLSGLQSAFGEVADLSVGLDWLAGYPGRDRLAHLCDEWTQQLDRARKKALRSWRAARRRVEGLA